MEPFASDAICFLLFPLNSLAPHSTTTTTVPAIITNTIIAITITVSIIIIINNNNNNNNNIASARTSLSLPTVKRLVVLVVLVRGPFSNTYSSLVSLYVNWMRVNWTHQLYLNYNWMANTMSSAIVPLHVIAIVVIVHFVLVVLIHARQVEWTARLDFLWNLQVWPPSWNSELKWLPPFLLVIYFIVYFYSSSGPIINYSCGKLLVTTRVEKEQTARASEPELVKAKDPDIKWRGRTLLRTECADAGETTCMRISCVLFGHGNFIILQLTSSQWDYWSPFIRVSVMRLLQTTHCITSMVIYFGPLLRSFALVL